ncbi:myosin-11-like isoform X2 [Lycium ferocissimum]|uniref:myosin-11-like isoform X2 n=1 Tax=Lycium ferocissimum TaxID=112874 RepID=UPI002815CFAE|nr:myosin-11-like isoform X2 [Lycium ferocissimum]
MVQINYSEVEGRPRKSLNEKRQEYQDLLIHYMALHLLALSTSALGSGGHLKLRGPSIFDSTIQWIGKLFQPQENDDILAYWLADISTPLVLLEHTLKAGVLLGNTSQAVTLATVFHRMTQNYHGTLQGVNLSPIDGDSAGVLDTCARLQDYPDQTYLMRLQTHSPVLLVRKFECSLATCQEPCYLSEHDEIQSCL